MKVDSKADVFFVHSELQWNLKLHLNIYLGEKNWGKKLHDVLNSKELESYKVISKQNTSWIDFYGRQYVFQDCDSEKLRKGILILQNIILPLSFTHLSTLWVGNATQVGNFSCVFRLLVLR